MNRRSFLRLLSFVPAAAVGVGAAVKQTMEPKAKRVAFDDAIFPGAPRYVSVNRPYPTGYSQIGDPGHLHGIFGANGGRFDDLPDTLPPFPFDQWQGRL